MRSYEGIIDHIFVLTTPRLGMSCHGILQAGFTSVFKKSGPAGKKDSRPLGAILRVLAFDDTSDGIGDGIAGNDRLAVPEGHEESPFVYPDVLVQKIQGVRANKSETWLSRPTTMTELTVSILATEPVYRFSTWLLHQQEEELWLSRDVTERPVVNLVTSRFSPVSQAISQCLEMLHNPFRAEDGPLFMLDGRPVLNDNGIAALLLNGFALHVVDS